MTCWLMKSEPGTFSIDDLAAAPKQTTSWDGVRNYQARNFLREMKIGDEVLFYHSSCREVGIVGLASVVREAHPDVTAFDPESDHFDAKSRQEDPTWFVVDVRFERKFDRVLSLQALKDNPKLADFALTRRGNRLSVMPVSAAHRREILRMIG
ncbi:MAG: EVE domain-containing protein [Pseudomonadales bacterium]